MIELNKYLGLARYDKLKFLNNTVAKTANINVKNFKV